eukprot:1183859-Karenia_brevis.AAC.1
MEASKCIRCALTVLSQCYHWTTISVFLFVYLLSTHLTAMGEPYGDRSKFNRYNNYNNYYGGRGRGRPYHNNDNPYQGGGRPPFRPPGNNDYSS